MKKLLFALAFALPLFFVKNESFAAVPDAPYGLESFDYVYKVRYKVFWNYTNSYSDWRYLFVGCNSAPEVVFQSTGTVGSTSFPSSPAILFTTPNRVVFLKSNDWIESGDMDFSNNNVSKIDLFSGGFREDSLVYCDIIPWGVEHFENSVPTLKLYRANTYSYDADLGIRDSKCYIWANTIQDLLMAKFDRVEYKLYVNNEYKATFSKNVPFAGNELNTLITFNYSDYGIVDDDQCSIQARAYKDNAYGLNSSLVWTAVGKSKAPVSSTPNVDTQVPVDGHDVVTITENNVYKTYNYDNSVNETYYDYSQSYITNQYISSETINNYITNNIQNITNNYYYNTNISVNYGESDGETFKGVRTQFQGWVDDLTGRVQVLAGTPFAPILFTFVAVIGALVAAVLIFVLIKIVGLIL